MRTSRLGGGLSPSSAKQHPGWLLIWAHYLQLQCYRAYSLFRARRRIELTAETLEQVVALTDQAEQAARLPRVRPPRAGT